MKILINIFVNKNREKEFKKVTNRRKKGYLLVDVVLALSIMSLLFLGISKSFNMYLRNMKYSERKIEIVEIMNALTLEIKYNLQFKEFLSLSSGAYYLGDVNRNNLIDKDIFSLIKNGQFKEVMELGKKGWTIHISKIDNNEGKVTIIYEGVEHKITEYEEVILYEFLE